MPSFDFISEKDFRESLESDYQEMRKSIETGSWKSAQVLAGAVVEALLIDYLIAAPNPSRVSKNPLSMDLAEAISCCRAEKALSDRTGDLCSVVRSYRNLIHPGRVARLGEPAPNRDSASIAMSLVELITEELAGTRRQQVGLTAEQLLSKLERDQGVLSIFKHLVNEANEQQRQKLLMDLLPKARANHEDNAEDWNISNRIESAFEITFSVASDPVKRCVAAEFVRILREEDGTYVTGYADAFFRASFLTYVPEHQRDMVRSYLLNRLEVSVSETTLRLTFGICPFLTPGEAAKWVDPLVKAAIGSSATDEVKTALRNHIAWGNIETTAEFDKALIKRLGTWKTHLRTNSAAEKAKIVEELEELVEVPF